jgi:hypothetical protein
MFSQKEKTLFNFCKHTILNLQKTFVGFIVLFIRIWNPKKNVIALLVILFYLFLFVKYVLLEPPLK